MADTFDYVIVGAGSAGCILANRLSADGKHTVCLLEAGPPDRGLFVQLPSGFVKNLSNPRTNWNFEAEASAHINGRRMPVPRGKTLGGSSSINGMVYNRGQRMDYDLWAQLGNRGWGYADVLPYFKRCEQRVGEGDDTYRGRNGAMTVETLPYTHPLADVFIAGAAEIGIPLNPDYNGASQEGINYIQRTVRGRRRLSTARAFLRPARSRGNLSVITNAYATKVLLDGKKAIGIAYARGGKGGAPMEVRARREVILSGGTINSPLLLQLSGIGPSNLLSDMGIATVHDLPGVGENLCDHIAPRFVGRIKGIETLNEISRGPRLGWEILKYLVGAKSVVNLNPSMVYGFWHSNPAAKSNDLQFIFTPASFDPSRHGALADTPGFTLAAWQHRPESRGHVQATSRDPFQKPLIQPNYLAHEADQKAVVAAMRLARNLMHTRAMAPFLDGEEQPGEHVQSDDELLDVARDTGVSTYHLMGTCRMSPTTDPTAVVDDQLRVHGIQALRVVDASVMPRMMSANLAAGTMMIAEKASDMILGKPALEPIIVPEVA